MKNVTNKISAVMLSLCIIFSLIITRANNVQAATSATDIVSYAKQFVGTPYVYGGTNPNVGFDCSGFVQYVYKHFGISLNRTTYEQIKQGTPVSANNLQPGDIVFPSTGHVQIYIGDGKVIHAPHKGDVVKISNIGKVYTAIRMPNTTQTPTPVSYSYEGIAGYAYQLQQPGTIPVYRYYNGTDHFYTSNYDELGSGRGDYKSEGIAFYIYPTQQADTVPLYRYNNGIDHLYTANYAELGAGGKGYDPEDISGYLYQTQYVGTVPIYRYTNGVDHFYTINSDEIALDTSTVQPELKQIIYSYEGISGYAYQTQQPGTIPAYNYNNEPDHLYTSNYNESGASRGAYTSKSIAFYMYPTQQTDTFPVYTTNGIDRFNTANYAELGAGGKGYNSEDIYGFLYQTQHIDTVPVYKYTNGTGPFYTTDPNKIR